MVECVREAGLFDRRNFLRYQKVTIHRVDLAIGS